MATDFGFVPVTDGKHYFVSYNSEDADRIKPIVYALHESGVPLWYDYGLEYGKEWERQIAENIKSAEKVIMFITKGLFERDHSYVRIEFGLAEMYDTPVFVVFLDDIDNRTIPSRYAVWWQQLSLLHDVQGCNMDNATLVETIRYALEDKVIPEELSGRKAAEPAVIYKTGNKTEKKRAGKVTAIVLSVLLAAAVILAAVLPRAFGVNIQDIFSANNSSSTEQGVLNKNTSVGDHVYFGSYPQDSYGDVLPIEWRVLDVKDGHALLISEYSLDNVQYNITDSAVTWETCTLREWMNNDFYNMAFSEYEKSGIVLTRNINLNNPSFGTNGGNDTDDYVFCLSVSEAKKYFSDDSDRKALATDYTNKKHSFPDPDKYRWWILRTPGDSPNNISRITSTGDFSYSRYGVSDGNACVRPAIWVTLSN